MKHATRDSYVSLTTMKLFHCWTYQLSYNQAKRWYVLRRPTDCVHVINLFYNYDYHSTQLNKFILKLQPKG